MPGWLLMRPPRPERTSLSFSVEIDPPCPGWMLTRGGGMDPPLARGIFVLYCCFPLC